MERGPRIVEEWWKLKLPFPNRQSIFGGIVSTVKEQRTVYILHVFFRVQTRGWNRREVRLMWETSSKQQLKNEASRSGFQGWAALTGNPWGFHVSHELLTSSTIAMWMNTWLNTQPTRRQQYHWLGPYLCYCSLSFLGFLASLGYPSFLAEVSLSRDYCFWLVGKVQHQLGFAMWCQVVNSGLAITCPVALVVGY